MELVHTDGVAVPIGTHAGKRVVIAADHRGFALKGFLCSALQSRGWKVDDIGTYSPARCDHPALSDELGRRIDDDHAFGTVGIGICGSGIGILICAMRHPRVLGARCLSVEDALRSRRHNNTNLITLSADTASEEEALRITLAWLNEPFVAEEPYLRRCAQALGRRDA